MSTPLAYLNGRWLSVAELTIGVDDLGFLMGVTLTERLRTFKHVPYRVEEHLDRLHRSLEIVGWNADPLRDEVAKAIRGFVDRNRSLMVPGDDWAIIVFITPGKTPDASRPTVAVHGGPLAFDQWVHHFDGVGAVVVDVRQVPSNSWPAELKCRSRFHYYLADQQAAHRFAGSRAILLDQEGFVGEGSTANVVAYYPGRDLVTPHVEKVLPGVSQQVVFDLAAELGLRHEQRDLTPAEFARAEEIYFTSTSVCLLPVVQLDGKPVGSGKPGPVFGQLLERWSARVGVDIVRQARQFALRR